jgi:hypothetical protein
MDWQQLASLLIVVATVLAFGWSRLRSRHSRVGCGAHCGCPSNLHSAPQVMIFRGKKGERSEVILKNG